MIYNVTIYFLGSFPPFLLIQLLQYLESGNIIHGGNFPTVGDLSRIVASATSFSNLCQMVHLEHKTSRYLQSGDSLLDIISFVFQVALNTVKSITKKTGQKIKIGNCLSFCGLSSFVCFNHQYLSMANWPLVCSK